MWPFKKQKEDEKEIGLPELPKIPELPRFQDLEEETFLQQEKIKDELPPLPSFPLTETGERITHQAVKQAINEPELQEAIPDFQTEMPRTRELDEREFSTPNFRPVKTTKEIRQISTRIEPIYIRIDKYQESIANLNDVKKKLLEIENLLREIKDIKAREETQLQEWEQEIQEAKGKLDNIDKLIFKKLE